MVSFVASSLYILPIESLQNLNIHYIKRKTKELASLEVFIKFALSTVYSYYSKHLDKPN